MAGVFRQVDYGHPAMFRPWSGKGVWIGIVIAVLLLAVSVVLLATRPLNSGNSNENTVTNANRERYAALYDAAWRQDDGQDATLFTATLLVPPTIEVLGADKQRSTAEEQLWNTVKALSPKQIPFVITIDSLASFVSDEAIKKSLQVQTDSDQKFTLDSWQPLIAPTRVVNSSASTTSQVGVAVFSADTDVNWSTIGTLKLTVKGIGGTLERVFTWTEPKLLLEL